MKPLYRIYCVLMALTLVMVLAALPFLPASTPNHYNAAGQADRWGSKYETLIFPAIMLPYGILWLGTIRAMREFSSEKLAERLLLIGGIVQFAVFDTMILYFLYADFRQAENLNFLSVNLYQLLCLVWGVGLIALGNWMPKLQKPGPVGLRTPWSMKNETVWRKCQRFGGWAMAAAGVVSIAAALLTDGIWCWLWSGLALAAAGTSGVVYSWRVSKTTSDG